MLFGQDFKNNRSSNGTELHMPADDAQWQVRNVKRHMRLLREVLTRMTEDEKKNTWIYIHSHCTSLKPRTLQMCTVVILQLKCSRDEIVGGQNLEEVLSSTFLSHVKRFLRAEKAFVELDVLGMRLSPTFFFQTRSRTSNSASSAVGTVRVVFAESRGSSGPTVIWNLDGGILLRAAPERLRCATRLDTDVTGAVWDVTLASRDILGASM